MLETSRTQDQLMIAARQKVKERKYWLNQLSGEPGKASIYTDKKRTEDTVSIDVLTFQLRGEVFERLMRLSGGADKPLHVILLSALFLLIKRYTGKQDIIIGTTIYRQDRDSHLQFTNTILPIRNRPDGADTFKDLLLQTRQTVLEAVEHQSYPMEVLVKELNLSPSKTHFPLFDAALLLENIQDKDYLDGIKIGFLFSFLSTGSGIEGKLEYDVLLYEREAVQLMTAHFNRLLQSALENPGSPLAGLEMLSDQEKKQLLRDFNDTYTDYPGDKTICQLFADQVKNTPDNAALVFADKKLTYKALNEKANQLARVLRRKGVEADTIVGLMMERSIEMITAILGILKAGGAYLPIDPGMPEKRILSMMNDCGVSILLTQTRVIHKHSFTLLQGLQAIRSEPLFTASRPQILDIDHLPIPDRSLVNYETYIQYIGQAPVKNVMTLLGTRGCPYHCAYCHKIWPKKHVPRSAENIFEEVKLFYDMGVRRFAFSDDVFNLDIKNSTKFFEMVIKKGLKVQFFFPSGVRGDILSEEYIDLMVEAGLTDVPLALETASPRLQKLIGKHLNIEKFRKSVEYFCEKHPGVILELYVMIGFPTETKEEALMTLDFIKSVKWFHFPYIFLLKIWENTDMAKLALANGVSRQDILNSDILAYQELPDTLPFEKSFVIKQQADFLDKYFLSKERLRHVLPFQMKVMTEDELVKKYDSYLPVDIGCFEDLLRFTGIKREELQVDGFVEEESMSITGLNEKLRRHFPRQKVDKGALRVLLLDLTRFFSYEKDVIYNVLEAPLGLMYLLTTLNREYGSRVKGKIAKSSVDFDNYKELKILIADFNPDVIGIRAMNHYKNFFHQTAALIRQWGFSGILITGGPYATSNTTTLLQDKYIDLVVIGEGEVTFIDLIGKILENHGKLPDERTLQQVAGIAFVPGRRESRVKFAREILLFDELEDRLAAESIHNLEPINQSVNLAYTIFTSGSTGKPKGTLTTHRNVIRVVKDTNYIDIAADDRVLQLSNYAFDGSVFDIYGALLNGSPLVILKEDEVFSLDRLANVIKREGITVFFVTTALFNLLVDMELECFQHVRKVLFGGERISVDHARRALAYMGRDRIIHVYGPTETTVYAAFYFINEIPGTAATIPIGAPIANTTLYILDRYLQPVPVGVPGEIYIGGSGTARGYMNCQELTGEKFCLRRPGGSFEKLPPGPPQNFLLEGKPEGEDTLANDQCPMTNDRLYRTGDLGRWLPDGNIVFLGRLDYQVKIRGFRVEPGEIENHLLNHKDIKKAAVVVREKENQEKYLCAYVVARKEISSSQLRELLSRDLSEYMIPSHFIQLEAIPLTVNGKVDRKALPVPETERVGTYTPPGNEVERKVVEIWSEILGIEANSISIKANFFELGGHSLKAAALSAHLHKKLGVNVPLGKIFQNPTVQELAAFINKAEKEKYAAIEPVEKKEYYPMSSAQKRLYFLQEFDMENTAYNMPYILRLAEDIQIHRLEQAFKQLISRHESLRTSFHMRNEEPLQRIHDQVEFGIEYHCAERLQDQGLPTDFIRPFDLSKAPMLRVGYIYTKTPDNQTLLLIDMHHIITDGTSQEILAKEFKALYQGEELHPLKLQYKDFAQWQNSSKQQALIKRQERYWLDLFSGDIPVLDFPTDFNRPTKSGFAGKSVNFVLKKEQFQCLKNLVKELNSTLFIVLVGVFDIFLSKLSGQEDIIVGIPTAGRRHADLEDIIGMFVNTITLRNFPCGRKTLAEFLEEVKYHSLEGFENQEYPFEDLVDTLSLKRDMSRNPLFDVMFNLLEQKDHPGGIDEAVSDETRGYRHREVSSKFDLLLSAVQYEDRLYFSLEYSTDLFKEETIERFIAYLNRLISSIGANTARRLSQLEIIPQQEKNRLLYQFNETRTVYPGDKTIAELFQEQVEKTPFASAVVFENQILTYRELDDAARGFSRVLIEDHGITGGDIVALHIPRSLDTIIGLMGILKAKAACLPIDPGYPSERINYLLADSRAKVLITDSSLSEGTESEGDIVDIGRLNKNRGRSKEVDSVPGVFCFSRDRSMAAYVIYTSGSTGKAKGVLLNHRGIINHAFTKIKEVEIGAVDILCHNLNIGFVASIWLFFAPLFCGAKLLIYPESILTNPAGFFEEVTTDNVSVVEVVPGLLKTYLDLLEAGTPEADLTSVQKLVLTGEKVSPSLVNRFYYRYSSQIRLFNAYGQSECSDDTLHYRIPFDFAPDTPHVPIGYPANNTRVYVLSHEGRLQPVGIAGELFISGEGLAYGYLNEPGLTSENFTANPYQGGEKMYRTGDRVRWKADGIIEFLGRMDHQVKVRGHRIELEEIENRLMRHEQVESAAVTVWGHEENKYLCAYVVLHCRPDSSIRALEITDLALGGYLAGELPGYMIPSRFMKVDELPLTPSGKIDRKRLPEPELEVREETTAPGADEVREKLTRVWSEILKIGPEKIDNDTSFFDLGGNSLRSVILLARIQKELNVEMTLTEVFEAPTIKGMAQYINKAAKEEFTSVEPLEEKEYYPLSLRQKRFYILQHMDESMVNNTPHIMVLQGDLERSRIEMAFRDLIKRHESLRTGFETVGREPVQRVHQPGDLDFRVDYQELKKGETEAERIRDFFKPFDLSCAPLLRVGLIKLAENKHVLMFDTHHIITDGMSMQIFIKESAALYAGEHLPPARLQYRDFSGWQNRLYETGKIKQQEEYWLKQFGKEVPRLQLPTDYPRPKVMRRAGDSLFFEIGKEETAALRTLVKTEDATIFMVLLAVYNVLLSKLTGQQDIVVGTGIVGRKHADLTGIIGLFFNTLALRNYPLENIEFGTFLKDLKERTLTSFENEDYPFDELVQELRRRGSLTMEANRNPVFETIFSMHNFDVGTVGAADTELPGLTLKAYPYENKTARYDLFLRAVDVDNKMVMELEYSTTLFKRATAERIVTYYKEVLHQVLENKDIKLKDITLSSQLLDARASRSPEDYKNFGF